MVVYIIWLADERIVWGLNVWEWLYTNCQLVFLRQTRIRMRNTLQIDRVSVAYGNQWSPRQSSSKQRWRASDSCFALLGLINVLYWFMVDVSWVTDSMSTTRETPSLLFDVMTGEVITGWTKIDFNDLVRWCNIQWLLKHMCRDLRCNIYNI